MTYQEDEWVKACCSLSQRKLLWRESSTQKAIEERYTRFQLTNTSLLAKAATICENTASSLVPVYRSRYVETRLIAEELHYPSNPVLVLLSLVELKADTRA